MFPQPLSSQLSWNTLPPPPPLAACISAPSRGHTEGTQRGRPAPGEGSSALRLQPRWPPPPLPDTCPSSCAAPAPPASRHLPPRAPLSASGRGRPPGLCSACASGGRPRPACDSGPRTSAVTPTASQEERGGCRLLSRRLLSSAVTTCGHVPVGPLVGNGTRFQFLNP